MKEEKGQYGRTIQIGDEARAIEFYDFFWD